jgi:vacuolar-type H+-ATPase subunit D/Vma8
VKKIIFPPPQKMAFHHINPLINELHDMRERLETNRQGFALLQKNTDYTLQELLLIECMIARDENAFKCITQNIANKLRSIMDMLEMDSLSPLPSSPMSLNQ